MALALVLPCAASAESTGCNRVLTEHEQSAVVAVGRPGKWHCTGVLISPSVVLTARHCLPARFVFRGTRTDAAGEMRRVERATHAPFRLDAALLTLEKPIAKLPKLQIGRSAPPAGLLYAVGFGARDRTGRFGSGTRTTIPLAVTGWGCEPRIARQLQCRPGMEMVVRGATSDTCSGDSGAPVFELIRDGPACRLQLVALVSRPVRTATVACGHGGVYTRVDRLTRWIKKEGQR